MAAAWYNHLTKSKDADSVGTIVDEPEETLGERSLAHPGASYAVDVMNDVGVAMAGSKRTQLTPTMLHRYDFVINMAGAQYSPEWLTSAPNYQFWDIDDPMGKSYELTAVARDRIKQKVVELIKQT